MTTKLKLMTVGSSIGVVLPKEVLSILGVSKGDTIFAIKTSSGVELTAFDPEVALQMEIAEKIMREDRDVLRKLAE